MGDSEPYNRNKRKRKKTFLQNAKSFGKKGNYGHGSELDKDRYQFFLNVLETFKDTSLTNEEKAEFSNNFFAQTENDEITCSSNQVGCRVIQMVLPFANDFYFEHYLNIFVADLRPLCSSRFASHVLQTLLEVAVTKSLQKDNDETFRDKCRRNALKISRFLINNLEDFVWDPYGNHIIRTVFTSFALLPPENNQSDKKVKPVVKVKSEKEDDVEIPEEYKELVQDYAQRLMTWPQFKDFPYSDKTSGLLQTLLKALAKLDKKLMRKLVKKLIVESFACATGEDEEDKTKLLGRKQLQDVFMSPPALMVLETAIEVASSKLYTQIYADCFLNNLSCLAKQRATNFAVQKLINASTEKVEFEAIFDELTDSFKEIFDAGHAGVILALGQACKRLGAKQGSFVQNVMKYFNCLEPEERQNSIIMCLCKFVKYEDLTKENVKELHKAKLNLHGTLIIELILTFNKPIKMVNGILNIDTTDLKNLFSNSMGSHIVDSYVKSEFVGEKSREKLVRKMLGTYQELAGSKFGSRSFEALWSVANLKFKLNIMKELVYKQASWCNSECGKIVANKINLQLYQRNVEEWKSSLDRGSKTQALFADIIGN